MKREDFINVAEETLDSLPKEFRSRIQNVAILVDGERGRNRTYNLLIKSQLLCQLSYAPVP